MGIRLEVKFQSDSTLGYRTETFFGESCEMEDEWIVVRSGTNVTRIARNKVFSFSESEYDVGASLRAMKWMANAR